MNRKERRALARTITQDRQERRLIAERLRDLTPEAPQDETPTPFEQIKRRRSGLYVVRNQGL